MSNKRFLKKDGSIDLPELNIMKMEYKKECKKQEFRSVVRKTLSAVIILAAVITTATFLLFPVLRITEENMGGNLNPGDIVIAVSLKNYEKGDYIAFYKNNEIFIKKVIALQGEALTYNNGTISIDGQAFADIEETNFSFPHTVQGGQYFVMKENNGEYSMPECVEKKNILGKLQLKAWPLNEIQFLTGN